MIHFQVQQHARHGESLDVLQQLQASGEARDSVEHRSPTIKQPTHLEDSTSVVSVSLGGQASGPEHTANIAKLFKENRALKEHVRALESEVHAQKTVIDTLKIGK